MATLALEINDAGLRAVSTRPDATAGDAPATLPSPGYALLQGERIVTGSDAAARARLHPRRVDNRFWSELDTTPLSRPFPDGLSRADLAHAHLASVWDTLRSGVSRVILVVPGTWSETRLGLLLGIARASAMPVRGLVDAAVAASAGHLAGPRLVHLDVQLHRVVATALEQGPTLVARAGLEAGEGAGIVSLTDVLVRHVAEAFVRHTRFDPAHDAATEQALYDRLPALLALLADNERAVLDLRAGEKTYSVELRRDQIAGAAAPVYDRIVASARALTRAGDRPVLLLSRRVSSLPGLRQRLAELGDPEIVDLPGDAAAEGALEHADAIVADGEALPFVTRLPVGGTDPPADARGQRTANAATAPRGGGTAAGPPPTHLVHEGHAHPITGEPLCIGTAPPAGGHRVSLVGETAGISRSHCRVLRDGETVVVEDTSTYGTFLDGQRVEGRAAVAAGSRLRVGTPGVELLLVRMAGPRP